MIAALKRFNWISFAAMIALVAIGTVFIKSAGEARSAEVFHGMWKANLMTACAGLAIYITLSCVDYRRLFDVAAIPMYLAAVVMLVAVLIFGAKIYGGRRWLWFFQPSEISKLCIIAVMAFLYGDDRGPLAGRRTGFAGFTVALAIIGIPAGLILLEPDLGTTLTLIPAAVIMLLVAKVWRRGLLTICAVIAIAGSVLLGAVYEAEKPGVPEERRERILKFVPLKDHQLKRIKVFLFPEDDLLGAGYTLRQAKISIGSGGLSGKGIGRGESNHLKYLPQSISMNDFIFCVYAEETGFIGSMVLLVLMGLLLVPCVWTAYCSTDGRGRLFAIGFTMLVFAHVFINIAMSIGMVPITGLPLPFMSSGRTFLVTVMSGFGLVQSVAIHGRERIK